MQLGTRSNSDESRTGQIYSYLHNIFVCTIAACKTLLEIIFLYPTCNSHVLSSIHLENNCIVCGHANQNIDIVASFENVFVHARILLITRLLWSLQQVVFVVNDRKSVLEKEQSVHANVPDEGKNVKDHVKKSVWTTMWKFVAPVDDVISRFKHGALFETICFN